MNTKKFIKVVFFISVVLVSHSCSKNSVDLKEGLEETAYIKEENTLEAIDLKKLEVSNNDTEKKSLTANFSSYDLKIIKSAETKYQVKSISVASKKIKNMVLANNGYVSEMRFTNNSKRRQNVFVVKVPNYQFDGLLEKISLSTIKVDYENITTQDVTEAYIDAESRLKTKLEVKKRYEEILRNKAYKVTDLLEVEEKINDIQEEIEAVQGKLNYMKNKVALSTINIELYEELENKKEKEEENLFSKEIGEGMIFGLEIIKTFLLALVYIWPVLILLLLIFMVYKRKRK